MKSFTITLILTLIGTSLLSTIEKPLADLPANTIEIVKAPDIPIVAASEPPGVELAAYKPKYTTMSTTNPSENEAYTWGFLVDQGFSRNQVAGIMGNLRQEHNFNTDGDGLAQWTDGRKAAMFSQPNPYSLQSQLNFLMIELNGAYSSVKASLLASASVEQATLVFQNEFEKCGVCMESQRIQYAYDILARH